MQKGLKSEFSRIQKKYEKNDALRDQAIVLSRDIIKFSKQAIYALHRDDIKKAEQLLINSKKIVIKVQKILQKYEGKEVGAFSAALEEYAEGQCYFSFLTTKSFPTTAELDISDIAYLGGLADCTGELSRRAVNLAIKGDKKEIQNIYNALEELSELYLDIEFRGIDMRKKLEGIKYNVSKTQSILYDLTVKR